MVLGFQFSQLFYLYLFYNNSQNQYKWILNFSKILTRNKIIAINDIVAESLKEIMKTVINLREDIFLTELYFVP